VSGAATRFVDFLGVELAPTPGRGRATLRIVVACVVATAIVMAFHVPDGHWAIITIFTVAQADAGASLQKGVQRVIATIAGGAVGIVVAIVFADQPWVRTPLIGVIGAVALFLSRTTTAPYVGLLGGITALIVLSTTRGADPSAAVAFGLWRVALIAFGVSIGTGAQLFLWPTDPEEVLLGELGARIDAAGRILRRCLAGAPAPGTVAPSTLVQSGLARHLDLLANAEARHPALRLRHVEQLTLVGAVEHLLTGALALERASLAAGGTVGPSPATRARLGTIVAACDRLRDALATRTPPRAAPAGDRSPDEAVAAGGAARLLPAMVEMERALGDMDGAMGFLGNPLTRAEASPAGDRTPLDAPTTSAFFTPAFSSSNRADLAFALKGGLAASICYILANGLAWPGIQTSIWTSLIVAQSSFGAIVQKEVLRLAGAALGGLLAMLTIMVAMPNMETLASFLVVVAAGTAIAAWITTGSARIAYAGLQAGLAFGICVVDAPGTVVNLVPARDRLVGILVGIVVTGVVFRALGPALASVQMRRSMATTLRSLAGLARVGVVGPGPAALGPTRGHRWTVYQNIATTLRLHDEAQFEAGAGRAEMVAARDAVLRLVGDTQTVFLALLEVVRHRLNVDLGPSLGATRERLHELGVGIAETLGLAADRADGRPTGTLPDLPALLAEAERAAAPTELAVDDRTAAHLGARLLLYRDLVGALVLLTRDLDASLAQRDSSNT
jgi:multidrug resistance protein MdtO